MKMTDWASEAVRCRRIRRKLKVDGYWEVDERGGFLWKLHRGGWFWHRITDVVIAPEGKTLFVKTADERQIKTPRPLTGV